VVGESRHIQQGCNIEERNFWYNTAMSAIRLFNTRLINAFIPFSLSLAFGIIVGFFSLQIFDFIAYGDPFHMPYVRSAIPLIFTLMGSMLAGYLFRLLSRREARFVKEIGEVGNKVGELEKSLKATTRQTVADQKRERFLNIPSVSFHYADRERIEGFYYDYFSQPIMKKLSSETTDELKGTMKASLPTVMNAGIDAKNAGKTTRDFGVPGKSLSRMFLDYQSETIKRNQVLLALEEVDVELTEIDDLEKGVANFNQRFGFTIDEIQVKRKKADLRLKAAGKILDTLEGVGGLVLIEGKFRIEPDGEYYKYVYKHPVVNYLPNQHAPVTISTRIRSASIEEPFCRLNQ